MKFLVHMLSLIILLSSFANASLIKVDSHCDMEMSNNMVHQMDNNMEMSADCCQSECSCSEHIVSPIALVIEPAFTSVYPAHEKVETGSFSISEGPALQLKRPPIQA